MLGFKKKDSDQDTQIPYQVYETVHEPAARRKRWFIRLSVALVIATLLIVGFIFIRSRLDSNNQTSQSSTGQDSGQVQQLPQNNKSLQQSKDDPAKTQLSESLNDRPVDQPQ